MLAVLAPLVAWQRVLTPGIARQKAWNGERRRGSFEFRIERKSHRGALRAGDAGCGNKDHGRRSRMPYHADERTTRRIRAANHRIHENTSTPRTRDKASHRLVFKAKTMPS